MLMEEIEKTYLSVNDFAKKLGKHPSSIRRAIKSNRINAIRIGHGKKASYSIPVSELHRIGVVDLEDMINIMVEKKLKEKNQNV